MDEEARALARQAWPRQLFFTLFMAALLFLAAGSFAYWQGWLCLAVFVASSVALGAYFLKHDPALIKRRMEGGPKAEKEPTQKVIIALVMVSFVLLFIVPALDYRLEGPTVPAWLVVLGDVGIVASFVLFFFVMKQNSYAASSIRVEIGQPVISTGLYGVVRHPMYSGALVLLFSIPLALGSYLSLLLLILFIPILAWRLIDEERVLRRDLPGYADYCERVRDRLIPFVW